MKTLVLVRHGQSEWNKQNRFTGWQNVELSAKGIEEARNAGRLLKEESFSFDQIFTSSLVRAQKTAELLQETLGTQITPIINWKLNERHYGGLTGLDKEETAQKHGSAQVKIWRRSYDTRPPKLDEKRAQEMVEGTDMPICYGESLKDTVERVVPYWNEAIAPMIKEGQKVLIAAHGNSIRGLMKHIFQISDEEITSLEIPTAIPVICQLDDNLKGIEYNFLS